MNIEIPPQLLKYAYAQQPGQEGEADMDGAAARPASHKKQSSSKISGKRGSVGSKKRSTEPKAASPAPAVVERLYAKRAQVDSKVEQMREQQINNEMQTMKAPATTEYGANIQEMQPLHKRIDKVLVER